PRYLALVNAGFQQTRRYHPPLLQLLKVPPHPCCITHEQQLSICNYIIQTSNRYQDRMGRITKSRGAFFTDQLQRLARERGIEVGVKLGAQDSKLALDNHEVRVVVSNTVDLALS